MLLSFVRREVPSKTMVYMSPVIAVLTTMIVGAILFSLLGYDGLGAVREIFITPVIEPSLWQDLCLKATPLILIGLGLLIGFKANVWNIGAEGQYIIGALAGTGVALATWGMEGWWILPLMCLAGVIGGMLYAAIPAILKVKLDVNEILTSLMLTYVAIQVLNYLMRGPWKDPDGFNFPQTRLFTEAQVLPNISGTYMHIGVLITLILAALVYVVMTKSFFGFQVRVVGTAPHAARYSGFDVKRTILFAMLTGGGFAGLAGIFEASGPFGQMVPQFPTGYGFTAIIVAFLGRLHPLGVVLGGFVLAVSYVGGELAQSSIGLPSAAANVFTAMMLFFLLATDTLVRYRLVFGAPKGKRV